MFQAPPASLDDHPILHPSATQNRQFLAARASLEQKRHVLRSLPLVGQRDADRRRGALLSRVSAALQALDAQESAAWERQKLLAGLYGFLDETQIAAMRIHRTGPSASILALWYQY